MKRMLLFVLVLAVVWGCNGQVQVPSANLQPVIDSLNVLKARVATLEALAVEVKTGRDTFAGTSWRKAVYVPGLTTAWRAFANVVYQTDTPTIDYLVRREIKPDSLIVIRQQNGTANLPFEWIAVLP